jgi:hypothetical protein
MAAVDAKPPVITKPSGADAVVDTSVAAEDFENLDCVEMAKVVQENDRQVLAMLSQMLLATVGLRGCCAAVFNREQLVQLSQQ